MVDEANEQRNNDDSSALHSAAVTQLGDRVVGEIGSLRSEIAEIRELLYRGHRALERAADEFSFLPPGPTSFRWGFMGAWGGGQHRAHSIYTTTEEEFFDHPDARPEGVAALAAALGNPHTIAVCVHLFRRGDSTREELQEACSLSAEELEAAVAPLLEWLYVRWHKGKLTAKGSDLCTQGLNFVVTLVGMARHSVAVRDGRTP